MRALQVTGLGQTPVLREIAPPRPGPGEVQLRIEACALNFADLLLIDGRYQEKREPPFTLGLEVAGVVTELGQGVEGPPPGTRVAVHGGSGGLAEMGCFPAALCVPVPDGMTMTQAASFQIAYGTSHLGLSRRAALQPGETLLVLGAAGGVGLTAVEIGKLMGAKVIACARGRDKLRIAAEAGADHVIDSETDDIKEVVRALGGADVVYDPVGGEQFTAALRACNREARMLVIGFASGEVPPVPANILLVKNISVLGFYWGGYLGFRPEAVTGSLKQLLHWFEEGKLHPHVSAALPLERANDALELLRSRRSTGKVVVTMAPDPE